MSSTIVRLKDITKFFPGVTALRSMDLELKRGEIHGLIGENGAGKSTLIKVLTGIHAPDQGEIELDGKKIIFLCDVVTVMRDGERVITKPSSDITKDELVTYMVGRKMENYYPHIDFHVKDTALEVKNLTRYGSFEDVSFTADYGEILGFSGLVGAGRTEVCRCLFGADSIDSGEIYVKGRKVSFKKPKDAIKAGLAFVTEDRKGQGLVLSQSVSRNICLANLRNFSKLFVDDRAVDRQAKESVETFRIKTPSIETETATLSGGNQQKVVIAKWFHSDAGRTYYGADRQGQCTL